MCVGGETPYGRPQLMGCELSPGGSEDCAIGPSVSMRLAGEAVAPEWELSDRPQKGERGHRHA